MDLFNELWQATKDALLARATPELTAYVTYFERQWIASRWCNWQRGSMAAGYSVTNNPVESENADIKRTYLRAMVVFSVPALQDVVLRVKQYKVRPGNNTDDTGSCSCPCFMDKLVCKHVLALRLHLGIVRVLPAVRRARAGKPRKRRRRALEYQTSSEEESEGEDK